MRRFIEDMESLTAETVRMGSLAADMIEDAVRSFVSRDTDLAERVVSDFDRVNRYDSEIEADAIRVLTLYQPVSSDLRRVATILKCITYLERIAKYSRNIAVATMYLADRQPYEPVSLVGPMGETASRMVRIATDNLRDGSVEGFDRMIDMDDYLDSTMRDDLESIIGFINTHEGSADVCIYYISVLKYLERVGDHACKIAEKVTFMVTGMRTTVC
ncbi:MAG: phosphate signaling complex protein PhoU [Candidatus Methanomethylophilaceae archaeon]|nr:phosphate signaling complex protein PhoU [Candidatus Methanomethylophilaceae archaeon]